MRQLNIFDTTKETSGISIIRNSRFQTDIYKLVWIRDIESYLNSKIYMCHIEYAHKYFEGSWQRKKQVNINVNSKESAWYLSCFPLCG